MESIKGECNCGMISVSISRNEWPSASSLCHCLNCRASSGSLFAVNLPVFKDSVKITGSPKTYIDVGTTGKTTTRLFCGDCGSAILSIMAKNPEKVFVKGGLFPKHGIEIPPPALELFMKRSESWEVVHENANVLMEQ